jgi:hypothetical protein
MNSQKYPHQTKINLLWNFIWKKKKKNLVHMNGWRLKTKSDHDGFKIIKHVNS